MLIFRYHRYLLREIAVPTGLALFIFTFILFMGRILKLAEMVINKGVSLTDIAFLFAFLLPTFLVITLPLAFLLGVLLGFGQPVRRQRNNCPAIIGREPLRNAAAGSRAGIDNVSGNCSPHSVFRTGRKRRISTGSFPHCNESGLCRFAAANIQ